VLFGYLRMSEREFYDTHKFCECITATTATAAAADSRMAFMEQQDVNEFCGLLFEKLSTTKAECETLLQFCFGGSLKYTITETDAAETETESDADDTSEMAPTTVAQTTESLEQKQKQQQQQQQKQQQQKQEQREVLSEREEPFFMITAEVANKRSLTESLTDFVAGDLLTGDNKYYSEQHNRSPHSKHTKGQQQQQQQRDNVIMLLWFHA